MIVEEDEKTRRDEKKWGKQERWAERWTEGWDELPWVIFVSMPVCEMRKEWLLCSAEMDPYLAMHEFKVDSFQSDLQESTFTSFHVLDREFSTQFWTWRKHLQFNQLQHELYFHLQNRHHLPYTTEITTN